MSKRQRLKYKKNEEQDKQKYTKVPDLDIGFLLGNYLNLILSGRKLSMQVTKYKSFTFIPTGAYMF